MLGLIFFSLQKFAQKQFGPTVWTRLFTEAGLPAKLYLPTTDYPDAEAIALVRAASRVSGQPVEELLEAFGTAIVPDLVSLYRSVIQPDWRTLDLIANAEEVIHTAVRQRNPAATPPVLQCLRLGDHDMQVVYASERRMCALA